MGRNEVHGHVSDLDVVSGIAPTLQPLEARAKPRPWYETFGEHVGTLIQAELQGVTSELMPPVSGLSDFFRAVKARVHGTWVPIINKESFSGSLSPHLEAGSQASLLLQNQESLRDVIDSDRAWMLRGSENPEIWRACLLALSQKEQANVWVAQEWLRGMSDEQVNKLDITRAELQLFLDITGEVQQHIDQARLKQIELADLPGGKDPSAFDGQDGEQYLYFSKVDDGGYRRIPFADMFPEDFPKIIGTLRMFSDRVKQEVESGMLPSAYQSLPDYLERLAAAFGSKETEFDALDKMWREVNAQCAQVVAAGARIVVNPWGFVGEGGRTDIELTVGITLGASSPWYEDSRRMGKILTDWARGQGEKERNISFVHQLIFVVNGVNHSWLGTALAGDGYISFYDEQNVIFARDIYRRYYADFIIGKTTENVFAYGRGVNTINHEYGHILRPLEGERNEHMGTGLSVSKLDELKADTMGQLFWLMDLTNETAMISPRENVEQFIIGYIDDIRTSLTTNENRSAVWYGYTGIVCLNKLFFSGAIRWEGEKIAIINPVAGVEVMAALGKEIFAIYGDSSIEPQDVEAYVASLQEEADGNPDIQRFLVKVAGLG